MMEAGERQTALLVHALHAAEAGGDHRRSVIAAAPADELVAVRLALELPEMADEADDRVIGFGTGIDEEDMLEALGHY
jgi:hypothetical protein